MDEFEGLEQDFVEEKQGFQMPELPVEPKIIAAGIIGLIIILVLFFVVLTPQGQGTLTVKVENDSGQELWKANVKVTGKETFTGKTDRSGEAIFSELSIGETYVIEVSGKGFETQRTNLELKQQEELITLKLKADLENQTQFKRITFVGPAGEKLEGKLLSVRLSCSTGMQLENPVKQISSGSLELDVPSGCGTMLATVLGSGFETGNFNLDESNILQLQALAIEEGKLIVNVKDPEGRLLDGIEVSIKDSFGIPLGNMRITSFGQAVFDLGTGSYKIRAFDPLLNFDSREVEVTVIANEQTKKQIILSEEPIATIKAKVIDKNSKAELNNSIIILEKPNGESISQEFIDEILEFPIGEHGTYKLKGSHEGYAPTTIEIVSTSISGVYEIELAPCTPTTCGALKVIVKDEDNLSVANVRVALLDSETNFFLEEYGLKYSNMEGEAFFNNVKQGSYLVLAQKFPSEGTSQIFEVVEGTETTANVELFIGEGTIDVFAVDIDGAPIPFGFADFRLESGEVLGKLPLDAEGKGSLITKADKKVFVIVEAEGFTSFTSPSMQVYPEQTKVIIAPLLKEIIGNEPRIELVGIFNKEDKKVNKLTAGNNFIAKFNIFVPVEQEYEQLGIFVRVGSQEIVEKDDILITTINAPGASVLKGKSFNPPKGTSEDERNITNGDAKWISGVWDRENIRQGIYNVEVNIRIKESTTPSKELPIFYRTYAINENSEVLRDPFDSELGTSEDSGTKEALYAESYEKGFREGGLEECDEDFCFSERLLDVKEDLFIEESFDTRIFGEYEYEFEITNNSETIHDNAVIRIKNSLNGVFTEKNLKIKSYSITNADSQEFSSNQEGFEIEPIFLGDFRNNKTILGKFSLRPEVLGKTSLHIQIVSDSTLVFERFVNFNIVRQEDLEVSVLPKTLPAFTEFDLNVLVKFKNTEDDFEEVNEALVRVERTTPDRVESTFISTTNGDGEAFITIPASEPGTRIKVRVEKEGFAGKTIKLEITELILEFDPKKLVSSLDLTTNTEERITLEATSLVPVPLHLTKLEFFGNFLGLLDEARMNNWLAQYIGQTDLQDFIPVEFSILTAISEEAKLLDDVQKLKGNISLEVANKNESIKWPLSVPFEITINLAEPPKEEGCLEISLKEWKDATLGGKAEVEFFIQNNCLTQKNQPLDLRNLKAKLDWKSNKFGNVELFVLDSATNQEASNVLIESLYSDFFELVPGEKEYIALLVFTPKGGTIGERAEFNVIIDAGQLTNAGEQLVGATNEIKAEIDIIDLTECVQYTPDPEAGLILQEHEEESFITVDSSKCGNVTIDFWLCKDDDGCAGGVEGGLGVRPEKFTLSANNPVKQILVSREEIPGLYGITVDVRTPGSNYRQVKTIDVLAKPEREDAFELSKYEFSVKGIGAKDSAELTNRYFAEEVSVDASVCDWGTATEKGWFDWKKAGIGAITGAMTGIQPAMQASKGAAATQATTALSSKAAAKAASQAAKAASLAAEGTGESVCSTLEISRESTLLATQQCSQPFVVHVGFAMGAASGSVNAAKTTCDVDVLNTHGTISAAQTEVDNGLDTGFPIGGTVWPSFEGVNIATMSVTNGAAAIAEKQALTTSIVAELQSAAAVLETGTATLQASHIECIGPQAAECEREITECTTALATAATDVQTAVVETEAYLGSEIGQEIATNAALQTAIEGARQAATQSFANVLPLLSASQSAGGFLGGIGFGGTLGMYSLGGFFLGGLAGGLFGPDVCEQRHTAFLPDYIINLLDDHRGIESENENFLFAYDEDSARIIGSYLEQRIGIVVVNNGIEDERPVYSTVNFKATQHLHSNPTEIDRGNDNFGPFNIPDRETLNLEQKIHLKFKTAETVESIPDLDFDILSCVAGNKIGRTGEGALPKVKLNWSFSEQGISENSCLEQNSDGIYCDATQFSIMLSKRLKQLDEFFEQNQTFNCPDNSLQGEFDEINSLLDIDETTIEIIDCTFPEVHGFVEGRPAIMLRVEATDIDGTRDITDSTAFEDTIRFNALLKRDGFTDDFQSDFARHYSEERFFDTPDWFYGLGLDDFGNEYGIKTLFEEGRIKFRNKFFDSETLSSAGNYDVLISFTNDDGTYKFFNDAGTPNIWIEIQFELLQEPNPNSVFYSIPFDGLVGLEGDSFNRQGYGVTFDNVNSEEFITINNEAQPLKSFNDIGSNPIGNIEAEFETSFFNLNTSPSERGNLITLEKTNGNNSSFKFAPSKATPILLKMSAEHLSEENLAAFYTLTSADVPLDVGSVLTYWSGAGACLDNQGVIVTETFDERPDRAATSKDPIVNWERAYAVDFGKTRETGDVYLRTIFYTNPLEQVKLQAEHPTEQMQFLTADDSGLEVPLNGVSGIAFNNPAGGSQGNVNTILDVFNLVTDERVCVIDTGRKASFFWNPKIIYELEGKQRNISEFTNSLVAGDTCIGLG